MKFIHIINVRWYNATAWYAVNIARILQKEGHEVIVAGLPGSPPLLQAEEYGLQIFEADFNSSNPLKISKNIGSMKKLINEFDPDVINCHRGEFFWYFALCKLLNKPKWKLVRVRGDIRPPSTDVINKLFHSKATDVVITSGNLIKAYFTNNMKLEDKQVKVIHGGVNTSIFKKDLNGREDIRAEFGFAKNDFVVGIVGRFDHVKGHDVLIEAIAEIYKSTQMDNIKLFLIGFDTTINTDEMHESLKNNGINNISKISGFRDDINACINALDLGVVASLGSEAICRVAMELMAADIPVISSDVGVLPEILDQENIYKRGDSKELAVKILTHSKKTTVYSDERFVNEYLDAVS